MADKDMMVKPNAEGWLLVRLNPTTTVSLPEYCHVKLQKSEAGRDHITIEEGPYAGKSASVKVGYLIAKKHDAQATVTFYLRSNALTWTGGPVVKPLSGGSVTGGLASFTQASNRVPAGLWDVEMPDFPHDLGRGYTAYAAHAVSWFRIATPRSTDRYIHPGTVSLGCVTVGIEGDKSSSAGHTALGAYEKLYAYLIARRKSPGIVGELQVLDF